jgi:transposase
MVVRKETTVPPYSLDLRKRILADVDAGLTMQAISEKYRISTKCIRDLRRLRELTGQIAPRKGKTGPPPKLDQYAKQLTALVHEQPDATLKELQQRLPVWVGLSTIWRALKTLGFTFKKSAACG